MEELNRLEGLAQSLERDPQQLRKYISQHEPVSDDESPETSTSEHRPNQPYYHLGRTHALQDVLQLLQDKPVPRFQDWYDKTKPHGGTKEEWAKLVNILTIENNLKSELRQAIKELME